MSDASVQRDAEFTEAMTQGVTWNGVSQISTRVFQFVVTAILARLLTPSEFGLIGMAVVFTGFVGLFTELGLSTAVIQSRNLAESQLSALLVINSLAGLAVAALCVAASGLVAMFFKTPELQAVFAVSSLGLPFGALGILQTSLLSRDLLFGRLALVNVISAVVYGVVSIGLALAGFGVWSLVIGGIALPASRTLVLWLVCPWRPKVRPDFSEVRPIVDFGVKVLGTAILGWVRGNADYLVVGRLLGAAPLGYYTTAFQVADFPKRNLVSIVNSVAFPAFSSIQHDKERLRAGYFQTLKLISLYVFPVLFGVLVMAPQFVLTVYGSQWTASVPPLRLLLLMGVLVSVAETGASMLYASGRPDTQLRLQLVYAVLLPAFVIAAVRFGITGVAAAVLAATVVFFVLIERAVLKVLDATTGQLLGSLGAATVASAIMSAVAFAAGWVARGLPAPVALLIAAVVGGTAYLVALRVQGVTELNDLLVGSLRVMARDARSLRARAASGRGRLAPAGAGDMQDEQPDRTPGDTDLVRSDVKLEESTVP